MRNPGLVLFVALMVLTACGDDDRGPMAALGPAPKTPGQVICVTQCRKSNEYCSESCGLDFHACVSTAQAEGQHAYELYATQKHITRQPVEWRPSDFEKKDDCVNDKAYCQRGCEKHYNSCYTSCNG